MIYIFFRIFYAVDILAVNYKRFRAPKIPSPLSRQDLFGTAGTPGWTWASRQHFVQAWFGVIWPTGNAASFRRWGINQSGPTMKDNPGIPTLSLCEDGRQGKLASLWWMQECENCGRQDGWRRTCGWQRQFFFVNISTSTGLKVKIVPEHVQDQKSKLVWLLLTSPSRFICLSLARGAWTCFSPMLWGSPKYPK